MDPSTLPDLGTTPAASAASPSASMDWFNNSFAWFAMNWHWLVLVLLILGLLTAVSASAAAPKDANDEVEPTPRVLVNFVLRLLFGKPGAEKPKFKWGAIVLWFFVLPANIVALIGLFSMNIQTLVELMPSAADTKSIEIWAGIAGWIEVPPVVALISLMFTVCEAVVPAVLAYIHVEIKELKAKGEDHGIEEYIRGWLVRAIKIILAMELIASAWRGLVEGGLISMGSINLDFWYASMVSMIVASAIATVSLAVGMGTAYILKWKLEDAALFMKVALRVVFGVVFGLLCVLPGLLWATIGELFGSLMNRDSKKEA